MKVCHRCSNPWEGELRQPGVKEYCAKCSAYLHCCLNCRFHDRSRPNQCRVPNTETVVDRALANFCDEFTFKEAAGVSGVKTGAAVEGLAALFGEPEANPPSVEKFFQDEDEKKPQNFGDLFKG